MDMRNIVVATGIGQNQWAQWFQDGLITAVSFSPESLVLPITLLSPTAQRYKDESAEKAVGDRTGRKGTSGKQRRTSG